MNGTLVLIIILIIIILFVISGVLWNILPGVLNRTQSIIPDSIPSREDGIQFVGHSTLLIQMQSVRMLTDPVLNSNVQVIYHRFISLGVQEEILKSIDLVLISHSHFDHLDFPSLRKLNASVKIIVPHGLKNALQRMDF